MSTGIKPIAIALLVIGLVVGGGAGYIVSDNALKPKLFDIESQKQELQTDIQTKSTQVSELESVIDETDDEITELEEEKSEAESDLAEVLETMAERQETADELLEEKKRLENLVEPNPWFVI
jgi:peptidoglycan hydrolase CwlO-like protein